MLIERWNPTRQVVFFCAIGGFVLTKFVDAFIAASIVDTAKGKKADAKVSLVFGITRWACQWHLGFE